jgi:hypothetical protein
MGYTHYWRFTKAITEIPNGVEKFKKASNLLKKGLKLMPDIKLGNGIGEGEPEITDNSICFNGYGEDSYETFHVAADMDFEDLKFNFCKTACNNYDPAVCLALLILKDVYGDDIKISSDGDIENGEGGWKRAKEIFTELTNEDADEIL